MALAGQAAQQSKQKANEQQQETFQDLQKTGQTVAQQNQALAQQRQQRLAEHEQGLQQNNELFAQSEPTNVLNSDYFNNQINQQQLNPITEILSNKLYENKLANNYDKVQELEQSNQNIGFNDNLGLGNNLEEERRKRFLGY